MDAVELLARGDKYVQYAADAEEHAERASNDTDRTVWHFMAQSWISLLPLVDDHTDHLSLLATSNGSSLLERLNRLQRLMASDQQQDE